MHESIANDEAGSAYTSLPKPWASMRILLKSIWQGVWIGAIGGAAFGIITYSIVPLAFHTLMLLFSENYSMTVPQVLAQAVLGFLFALPMGGLVGATIGLPLGLINGLLWLLFRGRLTILRSNPFVFYLAFLIVVMLYIVIGITMSFAGTVQFFPIKSAPDMLDASAAILAATIAVFVLRRNLKRYVLTDIPT